MKLRITETAFAELSEIGAYIAVDSPVAARIVVTRIRQVIDRIAEFPYMARPVDRSDVRIFPARPFPFLVFYTIESREVIIRNVRHASRDKRGI